MPDKRKLARYGNRVQCAGSGTSVPMRKATTTCMVLVAEEKGLCEFCIRTEQNAFYEPIIDRLNAELDEAIRAEAGR